MEEHAAIGRTISLACGSKTIYRRYNIVTLFCVDTWWFCYLVCSLLLTAILSIPTSYSLLDYIIPLENETKPIVLFYYAEYIIDQRKYYAPLMIKASIAGTLSMTVFITFDMAFAMCASSIFAVCSTSSSKFYFKTLINTILNPTLLFLLLTDCIILLMYN